MRRRPGLTDASCRMWSVARGYGVSASREDMTRLSQNGFMMLSTVGDCPVHALMPLEIACMPRNQASVPMALSRRMSAPQFCSLTHNPKAGDGCRQGRRCGGATSHRREKKKDPGYQPAQAACMQLLGLASFEVIGSHEHSVSSDRCKLPSGGSTTEPVCR